MRVMTSLIAMLLVMPTAHAQSKASYAIPSVPAPRDPLPRFTIAPRGSVVGGVGLPLPQIGLQPPSTRHERGRRSRDGAFYSWPMMLFYVPQPIAAPAASAAPTPVEALPAAGRLIVDVDPPTAQVFADGYYVGTPRDFSAARGGGLLEAGLHRIDVAAAGYESISMDVRVTAGQPVTIRGALKVLPVTMAVPPTTFYLIPGCYMGNVPPKDARLPATCDVSRAVSWVP
jgi:hypothetical protein